VQLDEILGLDLRPRALREQVPTNLRIGMIGLGRFVNNNVLPAYRARGYNVVAVADPDPAARDKIQRQFGIAAAYADYREMLDRERLDLVDINLRWDRGMSPERVVAVREAAQRGVHVQIAKPLAETWDQCVAIVEAAEAGGIKLAVNQNSRYAPACFAAGELVRQGTIGTLLAAGIQWDAARGLQHRADFDAVHDVTVHQVDIVLSWFDRAPVRVFANQTRKSSAGSVLAATLIFDDGSQGTIRDDFASELRRSWPVTIVGEEGSLDGTDDIEIPEAGQPRMARSILRLGLHARPGVAIEVPLLYRYAPESFGATMGDLLLAVDRDEEPWASGRNVLRTMRTLFAIERSVATGSLVELADIGPDPTPNRDEAATTAELTAAGAST
jgi:predicted dehydrogenase